MTMGLVGTWASVVGNEVSIRLGRQRLVRLAMTAAGVFAAGIGFLGVRSYPLAAPLGLVYGLPIWLGTPSLTPGAPGRPHPPARRRLPAPSSVGGPATRGVWR